MAESESLRLPQKRFFRQRAHSNPFADHQLDYPLSPEDMGWDVLYPDICGRDVEFLDVGCGYGGLLVALSALFPNTLMLGLELRVKVTEYVRQRIAALRGEGSCRNVAVLRTNAMKFLPNYFKKAQLTKMFFLFPDPHFKARKHKARIITPALLAEYAFFLRPGGLLYTATDVEDLHLWMEKHLSAHPLFERVDDANDPVIACILESTEEGKKVARNNGNKHFTVFKRLEDPK